MSTKVWYWFSFLKLFLKNYRGKSKKASRLYCMESRLSLSKYYLIFRVLRQSDYSAFNLNLQEKYYTMLPNLF